MEITALQFMIICPLVFLAGFVDAVAGGGGLISLPAYMIAGLPVHMAIGTYDGFYGPGTGTFLLLLLTAIAHMRLTSANGVAKVINLTTNITALAVYLLNGKVILILGLAAGCFSVAGNYAGTWFFARWGAKSVKPLMLFVLVIFFIKICSDLIA